MKPPGARVRAGCGSLPNDIAIDRRGRWVGGGWRRREGHLDYLCLRTHVYKQRPRIDNLGALGKSRYLPHRGRARTMKYLGRSCAIGLPMLGIAAGVCWLLAQSAAPASAAGPDPAVPRLAGKPDFNGIWQANNTA